MKGCIIVLELYARRIRRVALEFLRVDWQLTVCQGLTDHSSSFVGHRILLPIGGLGLVGSPHKRTDVRQMSCDRRSRCHGGTHQMGTASSSLPALEITIGRGRTTLARTEHII